MIRLPLSGTTTTKIHTSYAANILPHSNNNSNRQKYFTCALKTIPWTVNSLGVPELKSSSPGRKDLIISRPLHILLVEKHRLSFNRPLLCVKYSALPCRKKLKIQFLIVRQGLSESPDRKATKWKVKLDICSKNMLLKQWCVQRWSKDRDGGEIRIP